MFCTVSLWFMGNCFYCNLRFILVWNALTNQKQDVPQLHSPYLWLITLKLWTAEYYARPISWVRRVSGTLAPNFITIYWAMKAWPRNNSSTEFHSLWTAFSIQIQSNLNRVARRDGKSSFCVCACRCEHVPHLSGKRSPLLTLYNSTF